ncbi:MAG: intermembrane phospholipid transport protein YdbH family protein, partial [Rhodospirillales bacterium]
LKVTPTVIDSAADTNEGIINIKGVDLAAIFTAAGVDGVSGTGRLNGAIPVRMTGKTITITNGRLATAKPGVLKINSETVNQTLARGGPEVVLMLSALRDFYYEKLTLKIEKKPDGEGNLLLHTRGHNPAVRNGQPFIINLNLTGNVDRLAALAAQAFQLPSAVVSAMLPK